MKILMVAPTPFFADRGCHVRILEEIRILQRLGADVELVTYPLGATPPGVRVHRPIRIPWYRKLSAGPSWHKIYIDLLLVVLLFRVARRSRPNVLHAHLHEGIAVSAVVARLLKIPLVADIQGSFADELVSHGVPRALRSVLLAIERFLLRLPRIVVTSSHHLARQLENDFDRREVAVVPDAVDTKLFRPEIPRRDVGLPSDVPVVVYLGLLTRYQGLDHLLRAVPYALKHSPEAHFLIMGYPNVEHYQHMARELGIDGRVVFTGRIPYEDAPSYLANGRVAISPKISDTEANGKLLNYAAMGLPTVTFDTPVSRDILGEFGVYAPIGNEEQLALAVVRLLADPDEAERLGRLLRQRTIEHFSWEASGAELLRLYRTLVRP